MQLCANNKLELKIVMYEKNTEYSLPKKERLVRNSTYKSKSTVVIL